MTKTWNRTPVGAETRAMLALVNIIMSKLLDQSLGC